MRARLLSIATVLALAAVVAPNAAASKAGNSRGAVVQSAPPNIVFILTDDQRIDDTWASPSFRTSS